jgi:hypothetical protein
MQLALSNMLLGILCKYHSKLLKFLIALGKKKFPAQSIGFLCLFPATLRMYLGKNSPLKKSPGFMMNTPF